MSSSLASFALFLPYFLVCRRIWDAHIKMRHIHVFELDMTGLLACGVHANQAATEG
jgi:hypothetical protein